jgi:THO complex subunit 2
MPLPRRGMLYAYLQHCILPRVTYSPADAAFCARFTQRLHEMSLPFFPTILYFDTVRTLPQHQYFSLQACQTGKTTSCKNAS